MTTLTPREIVHELDKHIIGQGEAKRALAIGLHSGLGSRRPLAVGLHYGFVSRRALAVGL